MKHEDNHEMQVRCSNAGNSKRADNDGGRCEHPAAQVVRGVWYQILYR